MDDGDIYIKVLHFTWVDIDDIFKSAYQRTTTKLDIVQEWILFFKEEMIIYIYRIFPDLGGP